MVDGNPVPNGLAGEIFIQILTNLQRTFFSRMYALGNARCAFFFAGLTIILIWIFEPKISVKLLKVFIIVGLMTGLIQEGLQNFSGVQVMGWNTVFDLGVDILGVLIGFGLAAWKKKRRTDKTSARRSTLSNT